MVSVKLLLFALAIGGLTITGIGARALSEGKRLKDKTTKTAKETQRPAKEGDLR